MNRKDFIKKTILGTSALVAGSSLAKSVSEEAKETAKDAVEEATEIVEEVKNFTEVNSIDELFELKSSINETNSVDFLKHFYVVSIVEEFQNDSPKKTELIKEFDKIIKDNLNFSCIELISYFKLT